MKIEISISSFNTPLYHESLRIRLQVFGNELKISKKLDVDEFEKVCHYFLVTFEGEAASTGRLRVEGDLIKFERIATLMKFRGKKTGTALMKAMQEFAREKYPDHTPYMNSHESAVSFYENLGWKKKGGPFIEENIPLQAMIFPQQGT